MDEMNSSMPPPPPGWRDERSGPAVPHQRPRPSRRAALEGAIAALVLAFAATAMTVPYVLLSWNYYGFPGDDPPSGWQQKLWGSAAIIGLLSLGFGIYQLWPPKADSRLAVIVSKVALILAILGACVWSLPVCAEAASGL
jgi:hypothetical protein